MQGRWRALHPSHSRTSIDVESLAHQRFARLVEPHLPAIRAFVERRDPAFTDEVVSEVGVVAWRRLDDLPVGHERAWLFGVARTVLLAERRKASAREAAEGGGVSVEELAVADRHGQTSSDFDPTLGLSAAVAVPLAQALEALSPPRPRTAPPHRLGRTLHR